MKIVNQTMSKQLKNNTTSSAKVIESLIFSLDHQSLAAMHLLCNEMGLLFFF